MGKMILNNSDGTKEKVEIIMTFKLNEFNDNDYVFYKNCNKYYAAKYKEEDGKTELITNLSNEEKQALSKLFDKLYKGDLI